MGHVWNRGFPALPRDMGCIMECRTTSTILSDLLDFENKKAWGRFVQRFAPVIVRNARKLGFQHADAEDIAQTALMRFASAYREGGYDPSKGTLRNWIFAIARRVMVDAFRSNACKKKATVSLPGDLTEVHSDDQREDLAERWDREILVRCLAAVRMEFSKTSYRAFSLLALHESPASDIAAELGMTRRAVYLSKYRVMKRLATLRGELESAD